MHPIGYARCIDHASEGQVIIAAREIRSAKGRHQRVADGNVFQQTSFLLFASTPSPRKYLRSRAYILHSVITAEYRSNAAFITHGQLESSSELMARVEDNGRLLQISLLLRSSRLPYFCSPLFDKAGTTGPRNDRLGRE